MALRIKYGKVVDVSFPIDLAKKQLEKMGNAPENESLLKRQTLLSLI